MSRSGVLAVVAAMAGGVALVAVGAWYVAFRDVTEPASVDEAITTFREETGPGSRKPSPVPEGVYVYDTVGYERTDALTGAIHRYPSRSTITVTADPCGVRMRWDVLEGRSTTWTYCITSGGWEIAGQDERHTFFGRTERTTYTCARTPFRPAGDRRGATFAVVCSTDGAEERGTGLVASRAIVRVAGRPVATVRLRRRTSFAGRIRGTSTHDVHIARKTGAPVRVVMTSRTTNDSPVGDVHYEEDVSLRLRSLVPRR